MDAVSVFSSAVSGLWFFLLFRLASSWCPFAGPFCEFLDRQNTSLCTDTVNRIKNYAEPQLLFLDANATYQPELIEHGSEDETLTVRIWDPISRPSSQPLNGEFLVEFKDPLPKIYPLRMPLDDQSFIHSSSIQCLLVQKSCNSSQNDTFSELFNLTLCVNYDIYYAPLAAAGTHDDSFDSGRCNKTDHPEESYAWDLLARKSSSEDCYDLSLASFAYTVHRKIESKCFSCLTGGICSSSTPRDNGADCSCHINCPGRKPKPTWIIVAAAVGGFVLGFTALLVLYRRRFKPANRSASLSKLIGTASSEAYSMEKDVEALSQTHIFSYKELEEATEGFAESNELGDGGFGTVYKGKLRDGRVVAIKRLYENNFKREEQFMNEVAILNRLRHKNLVSLYGCTSRHSRGLLLVYEYVPNGTVADHLHGPLVEGGALTWPVRVSIAVETAGALAYLHAVEPQIIHRDVKTNNILLDENFHVKVADFGLSRLFPPDATHVSTVPQGTPGYLDPEYHQCYQLTDKSDVYSFGVVLAELISSKPAVDITRKRNEINLANMAVSRIQNCQLQEFVDPLLGYDSSDAMRSMIEQVAELAFRCLQAEKEMRPSMEEVLEVLKGITGTTKDHSHIGGKVDLDRRKQTDDCASLLNDNSVQYSPDTVHADWASRTTTPNTSGQAST